MSGPLPPVLDVAGLCDRFQFFCIDAFGVLVDHSGVKPGAAAFIERLTTEKKQWLIVTNDAARTPATAAAWYRAIGLPIADEAVLTSSALVGQWVDDNHLQHKRVIVLGPQDAQDLLQTTGVKSVPATDPTAEAIALCDEDGYPFLEAMDAVVSWWMDRIDRGLSTPAALANPDLIYPKGGNAFGIAAGSVATLIENAVRVRHPGVPALWTRLGKPHAPMFKTAFARLGIQTASDRASAVMIGDTLQTDIAGGKAAGIATALVTDGVQADLGATDPTHWPTFRIQFSA